MTGCEENHLLTIFFNFEYFSLSFSFFLSFSRSYLSPARSLFSLGWQHQGDRRVKSERKKKTTRTMNKFHIMSTNVKWTKKNCKCPVTNTFVGIVYFVFVCGVAIHIMYIVNNTAVSQQRCSVTVKKKEREREKIKRKTEHLKLRHQNLHPLWPPFPNQPQNSQIGKLVFLLCMHLVFFRSLIFFFNFSSLILLLSFVE